jgi:hypothetical protein
MGIGAAIVGAFEAIGAGIAGATGLSVATATGLAEGAAIGGLGGGVLAAATGRPVLPAIGLGFAGGALTGGLGAQFGALGGALGGAAAGAGSAAATGGNPLTGALTGGALGGLGAGLGDGTSAASVASDIPGQTGLTTDLTMTDLGGLAGRSAPATSGAAGITNLAGQDAAGLAASLGASQGGISQAGLVASAGDAASGVGAGTGFGPSTAAGAGAANPELGGVYGADYGATTAIPPPTTLQSVQNAIGYTPNVTTEVGLGSPGGAAAAAKTDWSQLTSDPLGTLGSAVKNNPRAAISALGLGYSALKGDQMPAGAGQLQSEANLLLNQGQQLTSGALTGALPPAAEAQLKQAAQAGKAQIASTYSRMGLSGSAMEAQAQGALDQQIAGQGFQIMQSLMAQGLSEQQAATRALEVIMQTSAQQSDALIGAAGKFAGAVAGGR